MDVGLGRAGLAGIRGDRFEAVKAAGAQQEIATLRAKSAGRSGSETAGSASDQNPFADKRKRHE
jgi:hypothetical protein